MSAKEISNLIPKPPIPSQVMRSTLPIPPPPKVKENTKGIPIVETNKEEEALVEEMKEITAKVNGEDRCKGVITIQVYDNRPFEVKFEGVITGKQIDDAIRFIMKGYRVWKHNLSKDTKGGN